VDEGLNKKPEAPPSCSCACHSKNFTYSDTNLDTSPHFNSPSKPSSGRNGVSTPCQGKLYFVVSVGAITAVKLN
jgi:Fanconi anemia group J protein